MTLAYQDDWLTIHGGDCRTVLAELPAESVHCVVTSPPYWGLRDYGVSDQLGLEPTPEQYVENMVAVFREVRRVLRSDGTVWLNLGDSYAAQRGGTTMPAETLAGGTGGWTEDGKRTNRDRHDGYSPSRNAGAIGLKRKDLVGIPWRVAFALQADGWYLRSDIIWSKPNPMPESVTDRPTKSHEYLFLLSKSPRYYFDADAVREQLSPTASYGGTYRGDGKDSVGYIPGRQDEPIQAVHRNGTTITPNPAGRNIRSVWTVATQPYPGAHFAVFPEKLVEPCILAGTSQRGVCPECGAPWRRLIERGGVEVPASQRHAYREDGTPVSGDNRYDPHRNGGDVDAKISRIGVDEAMPRTTTGWQPSCAHEYCADCAKHVEQGQGSDGEVPGVRGALPAARSCGQCGGNLTPLEPVGATVLDMFGGSGTTARVANRLSRRAVLIDLNPEYLRQQMDRNRDIPLGLDVA